MSNPVLSQKLSQAACELVRRRHVREAGGPEPFPADDSSPYLGPVLVFPAMLHFNGAALALELLRRKESTDGWQRAVPAYMGDLAALLQRMGDRSSFEDWLGRLRKGDFADGGDLQSLAAGEVLEQYLLLHHRLAMAAAWLKHYAGLFCPKKETRAAAPARSAPR